VDVIQKRPKKIDTYQALMKYSLDNLIAAYSMGESIEAIAKEYLIIIGYFQHA